MSKLVMFDMNDEMVKEWEHAFEGLPGDVEIYHGNLDELVAVHEPDIISAAGNSFGIMGAGIDGALAKKYDGLARHVRDTIEGPAWLGRIPVGCSQLVEVPRNGKGPTIPRWLAYTPTMPGPGTRDLPRDYVHRAMRGVLLTWSKMGHWGTLAVPGMGTGIGRVPFEDAAKAQASAYEEHSRMLKRLANRLTPEG